MGTDDKMKNKSEDLVGKGKETVGGATGNDQLEAEGKKDQAKAGLKDKVEDVKDKVAETFNKNT